jgi:hypothetical protein
MQLARLSHFCVHTAANHIPLPAPTPWFDVQHLGAQLRQSFPQLFRHELGTVVRKNILRDSPLQRDVRQRFDYFVPPQSYYPGATVTHLKPQLITKKPQVALSRAHSSASSGSATMLVATAAAASLRSRTVHSCRENRTRILGCRAGTAWRH